MLLGAVSEKDRRPLKNVYKRAGLTLGISLKTLVEAKQQAQIIKHLL